MVTDQDTLHLQKDLHQKSNQLSFVVRDLRQESIKFFYGLKCLKNICFLVFLKNIHACQKIYDKKRKVRFSFPKEEASHAV